MRRGTEREERGERRGRKGTNLGKQEELTSIRECNRRVTIFHYLNKHKNRERDERCRKVMKEWISGVPKQAREVS